MRASNSTANVHTWNSDSPLPYLFGGLGLMTILIAAALVILACSYRKRPESSVEDKSVKPTILQLEPEPRVVVIMAGDNLPSFLAKPAVVRMDAKAAPPFPSGCDEKV
ncbi:hypothetical protein CDL15_Pgr027483 [Punica granatum]|uniref:Uncharacterized protein n=1 Tax=Punica granatum TaxID=22663 RepID=A0A218XJ00_PUNGR|nr:hypothetical protein CDL15_Pgr027483 [Punica granatum]PKI69876.1 hypothetical protein CRG98_009751 [Punica granatum]